MICSPKCLLLREVDEGLLGRYTNCTLSVPITPWPPFATTGPVFPYSGEKSGGGGRLVEDRGGGIGLPVVIDDQQG